MTPGEVAVQAELESPESYARQTILHALRRTPSDVWTPQALASRFGISLSLTARVLNELAATGLIFRLDGTDDEFTADADL